MTLFDLVLGSGSLATRSSRGKTDSQYYLVKSRKGPLNLAAVADAKKTKSKDGGSTKSGKDEKKNAGKSEKKKDDKAASKSEEKSTEKVAEKVTETITVEKSVDKAEPTNAEPANAEPAKAEPAKAEPAQATQGTATTETVTFTAAEDAKLQEMKATNKSWKDIMAELNRTKHDLTIRWKEINSQPAEDSKQTEAKPVQVEKQVPPQDKKVTIRATEETKAAPAAKEVVASTAAPAAKDTGACLKCLVRERKCRHSSASSSSSSTLSTSTLSSRHRHRRHRGHCAKDDEGEDLRRMSIPALLNLLQQDAEFLSPGELKDLYELAQEDEGDKWLRVASRFFDLTGRRVHEEDVREKVEALMGRR